VDSLPRDDFDGRASLSTGIGSRLRKYLQQKQVPVTFNLDINRTGLLSPGSLALLRDVEPDKLIRVVRAAGSYTE
jgi:hypothetical protein